MRGVAYDPILRAKLMALHQQGVPLVQLSAEYRHRPPGPRPLVAALSGRDWPGLLPRSRAPRHSPTQVPAAMSGASCGRAAHRTSAAHIALALGLGRGTVQRVLERAGQNRLLRPARPKPQRYEKQRPGELLHLDIKFLPALRNARYDYEFAAVDDFSREAVVSITTEATSAAATAFLERVLTTLPYPRRSGPDRQRVRLHHAPRLPCRAPEPVQAGLRQCRDSPRLLRPHAPQSNGKVERFFRTIDDECLYVRPAVHLRGPSRAVADFVRYYNHQRPHLSLGGQTPVERRTLYFQQA